MSPARRFAARKGQQHLPGLWWAERRPAGDQAKFEATRRACGLVGWDYRLVGAPDPIVTANLRWLAGYRHPRHGLPELTAALRAAFAAAAAGYGEGMYCCFAAMNIRTAA